MRLFKPPRLAKWIFPRYTWRFFNARTNQIFITFDDGPHPAITPFVLDLLKQFNWHATFFCVGENVERYPEIVERIRKEGHEIGNHTQKHLNALKTDGETYLQSFQEFENHTPTDLFRPPYGRLKPELAKTIKKTHKIILWSWLSYDYDLNVPTEKILQEAKRVKTGDILVLHDNSKLAERQRELLPALFTELKEQGFYSSAISSDVYKLER